MKVDLNRRELHLIRLWWLSCEDMMIPEGTCEHCELKAECQIVRIKLYQKNGEAKNNRQQNNTNASQNAALEEYAVT